MSYQHLTTTREGAVRRLTLNRPDVRNAFNEHVIAELTEWADHTRERAGLGEIRVVVIGGAGKMFCAGADVTWMAKALAYSEDENVRDATAMSRMFAAIDELPLPVIGRIRVPRSAVAPDSRRCVTSSSPTRGRFSASPK